MDSKGKRNGGWKKSFDMAVPPIGQLPDVVPAPLPEPAPMPQPPVISVPDMGCGNMVYVMSYVKEQKWGECYEPQVALDRGTIFPDLDFPFMGEGACPHNE